MQAHSDCTRHLYFPWKLEFLPFSLFILQYRSNANSSRRSYLLSRQAIHRLGSFNGRSRNFCSAYYRCFLIISEANHQRINRRSIERITSRPYPSFINIYYRICLIWNQYLLLIYHFLLPIFQYFSIFARIIFTNNYLSKIYSHIILSLFRLKGSLWHPEPVLIAIISILLKIIFFVLVHFVLSRAGIALIAMLYFVLIQNGE